jgi:hypothetical protein
VCVTASNVWVAYMTVLQLMQYMSTYLCILCRCHLIQTYSEFLASKESCQSLFDRLLAAVGTHIDLCK